MKKILLGNFFDEHQTCWWLWWLTGDGDADKIDCNGGDDLLKQEFQIISAITIYGMKGGPFNKDETIMTIA